MKKFFVLLLIVTLAAFVFVGCDLIPSEGEGEGEPEKPAVSVSVEGEVPVGGYTYVQGGVNKEITVTLSTPAKGSVMVYLSPCMGDYSKQPIDYYGIPVVLVPNADRTVWSGFAKFGYGYDDSSSGCCATLIRVELGECETCWYDFAVIVDSEAPTATMCVTADECTCEGCELTFKSITTSECVPEGCCYDDCSGIAGWSLDIYCGDPFDDCCAIPCVEPIFSTSGTGCPIEVTTSCLKACEEDNYLAIFKIWDKVGNKVEKGAWIIMGDGCVITRTACYFGKCIDPWDLKTTCKGLDTCEEVCINPVP